MLCALDNETLVDLGMTSLGHRLNVLRNVYEIKKEQGVEMGEDDWRPQGECRSISERGAAVPHGAKLWAHRAYRAHRACVTAHCDGTETVAADFRAPTIT